MNEELEELLEKLLGDYSDAIGIAFQSLELPIASHYGEKTDILEKYKDIPMMSIDESFNTSFNFIITEGGTIVIFFIKNLHFISVFVKNEMPNKELALRIYQKYAPKFEQLINRLYEAEKIH